LKHGLYTKTALAERRKLAELLRMARATLKELS
jgi:hypothetical protein